MGCIDQRITVPETAIFKRVHRLYERQHPEHDVVVPYDLQVAVVRTADKVDTAAELRSVLRIFGIAAGPQPEHIRRRAPLLQRQFFFPEDIRQIDDRAHTNLLDGIGYIPVIESVSHVYALRIGEGD